MKRTFKLLACVLTVISAAIFTGCSSDDEPFADFDGNEVTSRSGERDAAYLITFEDGSPILAGPTSLGLIYTMART